MFIVIPCLRGRYRTLYRYLLNYSNNWPFYEFILEDLPYHLLFYSSVVDPKLFFSGPDLTFQEIPDSDSEPDSDPDPISDPT